MAKFRRSRSAICAAALVMSWPAVASAQACADEDPACAETEVLGKVETADTDARVVLGGGLIIFGGMVVARTRPGRKRPLVQT